MKVKILRGFCLGRGVDVYPGDVVEVTAIEALHILSRGRGIEYTEDTPALAETQSSAARGKSNVRK